MILKKKRFLTKTHLVIFSLLLFCSASSQETESMIPQQNINDTIEVPESEENSIKNTDQQIKHKSVVHPPEKTLESNPIENENQSVVDEESNATQTEEPKEDNTLYTGPRRINQIIIVGNKYTSEDAILSYVPFIQGEIFDPRKSRKLIHNLYYGLNRFKNIKVYGQNVGKELINVVIQVEEKKPLKEVIINGNKQVTDKEIAKRIDFDAIAAIDEAELKVFAQKIKQIYLEKGFHKVDIETELIIDEDDRAIAKLTIHEGKRSAIKQIRFTGNEHISDKELRGAIISKEDWILSFLDKAGYYHPEKLEADKHYIEQYYQNKGFLHAKVVDVDVDINEKTREIKLTYDIEEGNRYTIGKINTPGNDILPEEYLSAYLPLQPGMYYSREKIANSIKKLERIWGDHGYIFAHIEPSVQPNDETKTIDVSFFSDLGEKIYLNKITIRGNRKTRDKIIRRKIMLEEGDIITKSRMDASEHAVESLGYFKPRGGVNWKIRRMGRDKADLDLIVDEAKTGHFGAQLGFGGAGADFNSPSSGFSAKIDLSDSNLFGSGINFNLSTSWSKDEKTVLFHIAEPWLFDKPILGAMDIYHKRPTFDDLFNITPRAVHEKLTGGALTSGFITRSTYEILHDVRILGSLGIDSIRYERQPQATIPGATGAINAEYQSILDREFKEGDFVWLSFNFEQDTRNHPMHPSRGHNWKFANKFAIPSMGKKIGYYKTSFEFNWFTPLIGERDLVFRFHTYFGFTGPFNERTIPYAELFHIGGHNSVRGFLFGQIGPKYLGDPIGASKAMFVNAELIFPITGDMSMKAVVFYDGGAGFDNPFVDDVTKTNVIDNNFDYRHSVGVGVRLLRPMPVKIDWGFKIDPRKNKLDPSRSESASEVHFGMTYDW